MCAGATFSLRVDPFSGLAWRGDPADARRLAEPRSQHRERLRGLAVAACDARVEVAEGAARLDQQVLEHLLHPRVALGDLVCLDQILALLRRGELVLAGR